ncbi:MAG: CHAT domain-containing tetratricopeptide repeat protein, partial [Bacteroidota bacterium]
NRTLHYGPFHPKVAECYDGIANSYRYIDFNFNEANKNYLISIETREKSEIQDIKALFLTNYWYLGTLFMNKNYAEALSMIPKFEEQMKAPEVQETALLIRGNSVVGNCYLSAGRYEEAHIRWDRCFELADNPSYVLWASLHKALTFNSDGQHESAIALINQTLEDLEVDSLPTSDLLIMNYFNLGAAYRYLKQFQPAYENYIKCIDLCLELYGPKHERTMHKYERMGDLYQESNRPDTALYYYQKALIAGLPNFNDTRVEQNPSLEKNLARFEFAEVFAEKGRSWLDLYHQSFDPSHLEQSSICFSKADTLFSWIREFYQRDDQLTNFKEYRKFYEDALENAYTLDSLGQGDIHEGIRFMEKNRSLILLSALKSKDASQSFGLPDSLYRREAGLIRELEKITSEYNQALAMADSLLIEEAQQALAEITQTLGQFKRKLKKSHPAYVNIKYAESVATQRQITKELRRQKVDHFIAYFWGEQDLFCWSQSSDLISFNRVPIDSTFSRAIQDFQRALSTPPDEKKLDQAAREYAQLANYLSEKLIWPFMEWFENDVPQKVLIVPDGPLQNISFEALFYRPDQGEGHFGTFPYWIKAVEIRYSFSLNALMYQNKALRETPAPKVGIFSFSDGQTTTSYGQDMVSRSRSESYPELPKTFIEMQAIQSIFENDHNSFPGRQATKANFIQYGKDFDILHLGIHGQADTLDRLKSCLIFQAPDDTSAFGKLYPYELYDLDLKAKLAFLSACESGLGEDFAGEGTMSMGWAFAYAGVPSTVMSLWQLTDNVNPDLIESFYTSLQSGSTVSASLRSSKLAFLKRAPNDLLAHPAYWAASIPIGASGAFIGNSILPVTYLKWGALGLILLLLGIWRFRKIS